MSVDLAEHDFLAENRGFYQQVGGSRTGVLSWGSGYSLGIVRMPSRPSTHIDEWAAQWRKRCTPAFLPTYTDR